LSLGIFWGDKIQGIAFHRHGTSSFVCRDGGHFYSLSLIDSEYRLSLYYAYATSNFAVCLRQAIIKGCADIESLPNNLTVQAILATVQASLEKSE
jgi:hypothetical protein